MKEDALFCVGQKAFIEKDGKLLILTEEHHDGLDFPGGKIQEGELDFDEELRREVREEVALEIEIGKPFFRWYWEFPVGHRNYGKRVFLVGFRCTYKSGEVTLSNEHKGYQWVDAQDYQKFDDGSDYFKALKAYFEG